MAIFASTTLGSSDPSRAMSIKALEARAQALAQAQAQQQAPASLPSPWQGAALVANQAVDAFATKRADWAAQQQRKELGDIMGQIGPEGPNPQQLAGISMRDSDLGRQYAQQAFQARQSAAATQAAKEAAATQTQAQKEAAAEKAKADEAYAAAQEGRVQARPTDLPIVKIDQAEKRGEITPEEAAAARQKVTAGTPADQAAMGTARDENIAAQVSRTKLAEAADLLEKGIYHGTGAEMATKYGHLADKFPGVVQEAAGLDPATTERSKRYAQLLSSDVVAQLKALKGPASNKDMDWATSTINDPSSTKKNKQDAMRVLQAQAAAHLQSTEQTLKGMGTAPVKVEIPAAGGAAPAAPAAGGGDLLGEARSAIAAGAPRDKVIQRLKEKGVDASGL